MMAFDTLNAAVRARLRPKRRLAFIIAAAIIAAIAIALFVAQRKTPATPESNGASAQLVTTIRAEPREFVRMAPVSGEVRPVQDVRVFAPTTGVRIAEVLVEIGDHVTEGQPLARLESGVADARVLAAQADLEEAKVEAARASGDYERIKPIIESGAFSKEEVAARATAAASANARVAARRAALAEVNAKMQGGFVRAPAAGLVIERNARVGEWADQQALFRIVGDDRLEIAAEVAEGDILSLKAGQTATFLTSDGAKVETVLRRPPVAIDSESRTGTALFDLPLGAAVRTGMYLRGEVAVESHPAVAVPMTAVSYASGQPGVFVIEGGKARLVPVRLGARSGDYVAIESSFAEGALVAASGGAFLMDGDPVRIAEPGEAASQEAS